MTSANSELNEPADDANVSTEVAHLQAELRVAQAEVLQTRQLLAHTQHLLRDFLDHNPALSFIKDEQGRYIYASKSFFDFFQVTPEVLLGKTDFEWLPASLAAEFTANDQLVRESGKPLEVIETVSQPQGKVYSLVHKFPVSEASGSKLVGGIAIDITELTMAKERALESATLKSAFVANISHELRTPLSGILSAAELLNLSAVSSEQSELVEILQQSATSLLAIVNDLLDLSKIEAGKIKLESEPFNLTYLAHDCSRLFSQSAKDKGLSLKTSIDHGIPEFVLGDRERIRQTLLNLISNSVKFTESGSIEVTVLLEAQDQNSILVRFEVKDTGIGIAPADQRYVFQPFMQLHAGQKYPGTGLGLSIAYHLVDLMGGQMGLLSQPGQGSTFWFSIPFANVDQLKPTSPQPVFELMANDEVLAALKGKTVLVVEDNLLLQKLLVRQLSSLSLQAHSVSNGLEAVEAVRGFNFDLILMDCQLPVLDGLAAVKRIREIEDQQRRHTPVVALTAAATAADRQRCLAAGMDDYMSKPITFKQLSEKLTHWLLLTPRKIDLT